MNLRALSLIFFIALTGSESLFAENRYHFTVHFADSAASDRSLTLLIYDKSYLPYLESMLPVKKMDAQLKNGKYTFDLVLPDPACVFSLRYSGGILLDRFVAEAGDSIMIWCKSKGNEFSGRNSIKYTLMEDLSRRLKTVSDSLSNSTIGEVLSLKNKGDSAVIRTQEIYFRNGNELSGKLVDALDRFRKQVSPVCYDLLAAEMIGKSLKAAASAALFYYTNGNLKSSKKNFDKTLILLQKYNKLTNKDLQDTYSFSPSYMEFAFEELSLESFLTKGKLNYYDVANQQYVGFMKDKLITHNLLLSIDQVSNLDSLMKAETRHIQFQPYRKLLSEISKKFGDGSVAYNFNLENEHGQKIALDKFQGKLVYLHFWFKGCIPCAMLFSNTLAAIENRYKDNPDIVFVSISLDINKLTWINAIRENKYTSEHAINLYTEGEGFDHSVCKAYGVNGAPAPFLIGKNGHIISRNIYDLGGGIHPDSKILMELIDKNLKGIGR